MKKALGILLLLMFCIVPLLAEPCGDVNSDGVINIVDALITAQFYVGLNPPNFDQEAADVDGNDIVNIIDALQLAQYYVGLITELSGCGGPTPTPTPTPSPIGVTPLPETIEMQAETDATWVDAQIATNHTGYTGSGFVDTVNVSGTWIEWSITVADATPAVCDFRYSCASDIRSMNLSVNGSLIGNLTFPASGSWDSWSTQEAPTVNLIAGTNTIRLTATTSGGAPNIDKMDISINSIRVTPVPTQPPTPTPTPAPSPTPCANCTPVPTSNEGLVAFPGAEGYGKVTTGGRGGNVYEVTTLSSSGSGSLGAALSAAGPRTIVFRVGGTIKGSFSVPSNTTIAGQTAPGDGIEINGSLNINGDNIIVRYIRVRGNGSGDVIGGGHYHKKIIIDHVSTSYSGDEVFSVYWVYDITIQWCMITEAMSANHKFGGIWGGERASFHHNLFAHNTDRTPRVASGAGYNDLRNNVIYNWKNFGIYGGERIQTNDSKATSGDGCWVNVVANYMKPGPGTPTTTEKHTMVASPWMQKGGAVNYGKWYVADNYVAGHPEVTADNWKGVFPYDVPAGKTDLSVIPGLKLNTPAQYMPINQQTAEDAYTSVLAHAGCSLPVRDPVDTRIIEEVRTTTASKGDNGFVSNIGQSDGHPTLKNGTAPADSDHDGMPDAWENAHGLNPNNANDRNTKDAIGYTMLENYLNSLASFK